MSKRSGSPHYECHEQPSPKVAKLNDHNMDEKFSKDIIVIISSFLTIGDVLSSSLVNQQFNQALNKDEVWENLFRRKYSTRLIKENDPIVGGQVFQSVKSNLLNSSEHRAHYALKSSFSKLKVISHENVFKKYDALFEENDDGAFVYKDGDDNFEPTIEMEQLASHWLTGDTEQFHDPVSENQFAYFFKYEAEGNRRINLSKIKNELTNQIFTLVDVSISNPYGSYHLGEGKDSFMDWFEGNTNSNNVDIDLAVWLERMACSLGGCPERTLHHPDHDAPVEIAEFLGFERDENNLLQAQFSNEESDNEQESNEESDNGDE